MGVILTKNSGGANHSKASKDEGKTKGNSQIKEQQVTNKYKDQTNSVKDDKSIDNVSVKKAEYDPEELNNFNAYKFPPDNNSVQYMDISKEDRDVDNNMEHLSEEDFIATEREREALEKEIDEFGCVEEYGKKETEEQVFQISEHILACMCPIVIVDTKTMIYQLNHFAEETFGLNTKEIEGKNISIMLDETSASTLQQRIRDYLSTRKKTLLSDKMDYYINETCKGGKRTVYIKMTEMVNNAIPYFICYLQIDYNQKGSKFEQVEMQNNEIDDDDDEVNQSDGASLASEKKIEDMLNEGSSEGGEIEQTDTFKVHSAITELSTIPIISIDPESIVNTWNPAAERVFGILKSEIIGSSLVVIMPQEIAEKHNWYVQRYIKTGVKRVVDKTRVVNGKRKTGEVFPVELKITEILDDQEQRLFIGFARDMTAVITKSEQYKHLAEQIFPASIASRVVNGDLIHDSHEEVTIMFCGIENFTELSVHIPPKQLITLLDSVFQKFDGVTKQFELEKIKTIGENYMLASGVPEKNVNHAANAVKGALAMIEIAKEFNDESQYKLNIKVGIATGEVVAGIVGKKKPAYDVWGSTVNFASRMQSTTLRNRIQISVPTYELLPADIKQLFIHRQGVAVKGIGYCDTYISEQALL
ncbi:hypothetical protein ABK040_011592 [Willaertia magna]